MNSRYGSYPETERNRSTYCLELIFSPSPLAVSPILSSFSRSWKAFILLAPLLTIPTNSPLPLPFRTFSLVCFATFSRQTRGFRGDWDFFSFSFLFFFSFFERLGKSRRDEWRGEFGKRGQVRLKV